MEKTEAVGKLQKAGYQVQFDSSVVTVLLPGTADVSRELKKLRGFLEEIGYDASFGIKQTRNVDKEEWSASSVSSDAVEEDSKELEIGEQFSLEDFGL